MAVRGLNNLRSKARKTLEKQALDLQTWNPKGAELLRKDARHMENWGREAAEGLGMDASRFFFVFFRKRWKRYFFFFLRDSGAYCVASSACLECRSLSLKRSCRCICGMIV